MRQRLHNAVILWGIGFFLFLLFSFPRFVSAATLTVCEDGCTYKTIQEAVDAIPAKLTTSYVVEIQDSREYTAVRIGGKKTTATKTITIRAKDPETPMIVSKSYESVLTLHYQSFIIIDGLRFSGKLQHRAGGISLDGASDNQIRHSSFVHFDAAQAVVIHGGERNIIENNIFKQSRSTTGVLVYYYNGGNVIRGNTFVNLTKAIVLGNRVRATTIEDNTFFLDGETSIAIASDVDLARTKLSTIDRNQYYLARGATLGKIQDTVYTTLDEWRSATEKFDRASTIITAPNHPAFTPWREVTKTVCATGCDYTTIREAVDAIPSRVPGISHELISDNISYRIEVRDAGPYDGGIRLGIITDADHTLTIAAAPGVRPVIRQSDYAKGFEIHYSDYITIKGFFFPGGHKTNFFGGAIWITGSNNTIEDNRIEDADAPAVVMYGGTRNRILSNQIWKTSRGVFIYGSEGGHIIRGNIVAHTFSAIAFKDQTANITIENNTFFKNKRGLDIGPEWSACVDADKKKTSCAYTMRNTIVVTDGENGAAFFFAKSDILASLDADYNLFFTENNAPISHIDTTVFTTLATWQGQGKDAHSIVADPLFAKSDTSPYDFHIKSKGGRYDRGIFFIDTDHSPAIDAGDPGASFDREPMPHGNRANIGAYSNTEEASKTFVAPPPPPPPPPPPSLSTGIWTDTTDSDWLEAVKQAVIIRGSGSAASITLEGGGGWESVLLGTTETIGNAAFFSEDDGFAIGSNGTILRFHGTTWKQEHTGTRENLWGLSFAHARFGFTVGSRGTILLWDGVSWKKNESGTKDDLTAVAVTSVNDAWAVGNYGTMLHWNGTVWERVATVTTQLLNGVALTSSTQGWAVGNQGVILRFDGGTWHTFTSPTNKNLLAVAEQRDGSVVVIGDDGFISRYIDGVWTTASKVISEALLSLIFLPNGRGWISGEWGTLLETTDGRTWSRVATGTTESLFTIIMAGETQWLMGTNGMALRKIQSAQERGSVTSRVFDASTSPTWKTMKWEGEVKGGASVRFQFATATKKNGPWDFVGPDGTANSFYTTKESSLSVQHHAQRFARYRVVLERGENTAPVIDAVIIEYDYNPDASPLPPTLRLPIDGAIIKEGDLLWEGVLNPDSYEVEVGYGTMFERSTSIHAKKKTTVPIPNLPDGVYVWRVRVATARGQSPWSEIFSFTLDRVAPSVPRLIIPVSGSTIFVNPTFRWGEQGDEDTYDFQLATTTDFTLPLIDRQDLRDALFDPAFILREGVFVWRVRARDRAKNVSAWADATFLLQRITDPPTIAPPLLTPRSGMVTNDRAISFSWERIPDTLSYTLHVALDDAFTDVLVREESTTTTQWLWKNTIADGRYFWRVRGVNGGGEGPWSSTGSFVIDTEAPAPPIPVAPDQAAVLIFPAKPQFLWGDVADAVRYELVVGEKPTPSDPRARRQENIVTTTFTFTPPFDTGDYFWHIRAFDLAGNISTWSAPSWTFSVVAEREKPPVVLPPTLIAPDDEAMIDGDPTLVWEGVPEARNYDVEIASSSHFNTQALIVAQTITHPKTQLVVPLENLPEIGERYFWRVRVTTPKGTSTFSKVRSFVTDRIPPGTPRIIAPGEGEVLSVTNPTITWERGDSDVASYTVTIMADGAGTPIVLLLRTLPSRDTTTFPATLPGNGRYRVTLSANDRHGNSSRPAVVAFSIVSPPDAPQLLAPAHDGVFAERTVVFQWVANVGTNYTMTLAHNPSFTEGKEYVGAGEVIVSDLSDGIYYWRVRGVINRIAGSHSETRFFTIDATPSSDIDFRRVIATYYPKTPTPETLDDRCKEGSAYRCTDDGRFQVKKREHIAPDEKEIPTFKIPTSTQVKRVMPARGSKHTRTKESAQITTLILGRVGRVYTVSDVVSGDTMTIIYDARIAERLVKQAHKLALARRDPATDLWIVVPDATQDAQGHAFTAIALEGDYAVVVIVEKRGEISVPLPSSRVPFPGISLQPREEQHQKGGQKKEKKGGTIKPLSPNTVQQ